MLAAALACLVVGCARKDYADRSTLQLPVYPGAVKVSAPASVLDRSGHIIEVFSTADSFDNVRDWYARTMPRESQSVVNEAKREATYALFDDRRRSVHLEVSGYRVYIYLSGTAPQADGR